MSKTLICLIDTAKVFKKTMQNLEIVNYPIYRQIIVKSYCFFVKSPSISSLE